MILFYSRREGPLKVGLPRYSAEQQQEPDVDVLPHVVAVYGAPPVGDWPRDGVDFGVSGGEGQRQHQAESHDDELEDVGEGHGDEAADQRVHDGDDGAAHDGHHAADGQDHL